MTEPPTSPEERYEFLQTMNPEERTSYLDTPCARCAPHTRRLHGRWAAGAQYCQGPWVIDSSTGPRFEYDGSPKIRDSDQHRCGCSSFVESEAKE